MFCSFSSDFGLPRWAALTAARCLGEICLVSGLRRLPSGHRRRLV
jgi:hypothetical protein